MEDTDDGPGAGGRVDREREVLTTARDGFAVSDKVSIGLAKNSISVRVAVN